MNFNHTAKLYESKYTRTPFKQVWSMFAIAKLLVSLPVWTLSYFIKGKEHPSWNLGRQLLIKIFYELLELRTVIVDQPVISLKTDKKWIGKKSRYLQIPAASAEYLVGSAATKDSQGRTPSFEDVPAYWYNSKRTEELLNKKQDYPSTKDGVLLFFHGGAYVVGSAEEDADVAPMVVHLSKTGLDVLSVNYRISGRENPYPSQLQDAVSAYRYLVKDLKYNASKIIVGGDSAGGNLAIALTRYIAENGQANGLIMPAGALLLSPWVDLSLSISSKHTQFDYLPLSFVEWGSHSLISGYPLSKLSDPKISPFFESEENLAKIVPSKVFINYGGTEALKPEIEQFAEKIRKGRRGSGTPKNAAYLKERKDGTSNEEAGIVLDEIDSAPHDILIFPFAWTESIQDFLQRVAQWAEVVLH